MRGNDASSLRMRAAQELGQLVYPETSSIEIASARLGIGRSLGYQLAREGRFPVPVIRAGRRLLVSTAALDRLLSNEPAKEITS